MLKIFFISFVILILSNSLFSQNSKQELDKKAIKGMCGCYEVGFNFAETFVFSKDSTYKPSKVKYASALEFAQLVKETDDKVVIQHLLIVGGKDNPMIIKHWRQDWIYENQDLYMFNADNKWDFMKLSKNNVKGQWTQKVFQVDDSPRYEGSSSWVHVDGQTYWENTTDAPLPRREYTKRSDYNVTVRTNRHEITKDGWIHDQDNSKVLREDGTDVLLAREKGYNTYNRVDDSKCEAAIKWWQENKDYWANVRGAWDEVYSKNKDLELAEKVDGKRLYEVLFFMDTKTPYKKIKKIIKSYVK